MIFLKSLNIANKNIIIFIVKLKKYDSLSKASIIMTLPKLSYTAKKTLDE